MKKGIGTNEGRARGGSNSGGNFKHNPARAAEAGRKGGQLSGGNFRNNPSRAAEAGRKGGLNSHGRNNGNGNGSPPQTEENPGVSPGAPPTQGGGMDSNPPA